MEIDTRSWSYSCDRLEHIFLGGLWKAFGTLGWKSYGVLIDNGALFVEAWKIRLNAQSKVDGGGPASEVSERILKICLGSIRIIQYFELRL